MMPRLVISPPEASEMGRLVREYDWASTPLGPMDRWPSSLRAAVNMALASQYPMALCWGPDLRVIYNDGIRPMLGSTRHPGALGMAAADTVPEVWPLVEPLIAVTMEGQSVWAENLRLDLAREGRQTESYFSIAMSSLTSDQGVIEGFFAQVIETTTTVLRERRLRALRQLSLVRPEAEAAVVAHLMSVLERHPSDVPFALLYLASADRRTLRLAGQAGGAAGTGWAPAELPLEAHGALELGLVLRTGRATTVRLPPAALRPGEDAPEHARVVPLMASDGRVVMGALVLGISPAARLNDEHLDFLDLVASQASAAITTARAYEDEHRRVITLMEIDQARTAFFNSVSHELRTPLSLILAPVEDGLDDTREPLPPGQRERQQIVRRNALRILKLVNALLDFNRVEAMRQVPAFEAVDLAQLTADITSTFRALVERAGLLFQVESDPLPWPVQVDRQMWETILLNLLSNAYKYTLDGRILVRVEGQVEGADPRECKGGARFARLVVSDTGVGIAERHLDHIFDRFYRVDTSMSRSFEGSGIGLALVRELVHLHGGQIEVVSTPGQGTTFTVTLPVRDATAEAAPSAAPHTSASARLFIEEAGAWVAPRTGPAESTSDESQSGYSILVAEDNPDMRAYLTRLMRPLGRVRAVGDGAAALEEVRRSPPDLLLLDGVLPVVDGLEVLRAIRQTPATLALPVVMLSSRGGGEAMLEGTSAGADHYLVKPFVSRELVAIVRSALQLTRQRFQIREREEEFRAAFHGSSVGMVQCAPLDGTFLQVNPRFCEMLQREPQELLGLSFMAITHPDDAEGNFVEFQRLGRGEIPVLNLRKRLLRKDGSALWVDVTANLVRDAEGRPLRSLGIVQDVSEAMRVEAERERHLAEEREAAARVARSQQQLAAVLSAVQDGIAVFSASGELLHSNEASQQIRALTRPKGYPSGLTPLPDLRLTDGATGRDIPFSEWPVNRVLRGEVLRDVELQLRRLDTDQEWTFSFSGAPVYGPGPDERMAVTVVRDVTERARTRAELVASRARLARDLEAMTALHALALQQEDGDEDQALLDQIAEVAMTIGQARFAILEVNTGGPSGLRLVSHTGDTAHLLPILEPLLAMRGSIRSRALQTAERASVVLADVPQDSLRRVLGPRGEALLRSFDLAQTTPLKSRSGKLVGLLTTGYLAEHAPQDRDLRMLDLLARQSADIVDRATQARLVEELRAANSRSEEFLVAVADSVLIVREDGTIEYVNALAERIFGYGRGEMVGLPLSRLIPDRYHHVHHTHLGTYFANPRVRPMGDQSGRDLWARRKDGSEFPVEVSLGPIPTASGILVSAVVRDVTQRREAERTAEMYAARLSSAVEIIADLVAIWDESGALVTANTSFRSLLGRMGLSGREPLCYADFCVSAADYFVFVDEAARGAFLEERARMAAEARESFEVLTDDGHVLWFTLQRTAEGGDVLTGMDISEEIRQKDELEQARREAEAASRAKSEFLASMSHELRTPLNAVLGFAQLLQRDRRGELSPIQREMVNHIVGGGTHLLRLIDDILDLARIEASGVAISPEPVFVADALRDVVRTLQSAAHDAGVTLMPLQTDEDMMVFVDRGRFAQILMNFGSNAIKYNRRGGTLAFEASTPEPDTVRVTVVDSGIGVPLDQQHKLFQPFHRAGQETGSIEGSGIGLAICKRLADVMRGSVGFESTPGEGSRFWVNVPLHRRSAMPSPVELRTTDSPLKVERPTLVLCVDDNPASVTLLRTLFSLMENIELISASTAEEGIELARTRHPDIILMDIHLPGISGLDALRLLRGWPETREIPVIALTAAATEMDRQLGRQAGFEQYLVKPVRIDHLEAVIVGALERRRGSEPAR